MLYEVSRRTKEKKKTNDNERQTENWRYSFAIQENNTSS